jgi:hypothetical protein
MIHTDEDDEFDRIARENAMKGQPYHFDIFVSPSQRNQVLEECAKLADQWDLPVFAKTIRERKE